MHNTKRSRGQFFTVKQNPFESVAFAKWAKLAGLPDRRILEPFAGANHIIKSLQNLNLCQEFESFDVAPADSQVKTKDTIASFPIGFEVCITNPPWLARNSATRRNLPYPTCQYDDLYKLCLELCLTNCEYVAALMPASYLQSGLFRDRLHTFILLHELIFNDTENPVCLALFTGDRNDATEVYYDDQLIGELRELQSKIPAPIKDRVTKFNDPAGQLGFISFDNTRERSIRFCETKEIESYEIKVSSRFITRISGNFEVNPVLIRKLNGMINKFRDETSDLFLTPFKGIRIDGQYRRRMFFSQARRFINAI